MIDREYLKQAASRAGFELDELMLEKLDCYAEMLIDWNKNVNLTAITDPKEIVIKHFVDSFLLLNHIEYRNSSIIDVGAGAGFPTLPCKIVQEDLQITMLDSLNKRISFLDAVCEKLKERAKAVHGRAEEQGREAQYREKFDVATARAVAHLRELTEYCLPFVKVGGFFVALKGYEIEQELEESTNAIKLLGGEIEGVYKYELEDSSRRAIICIKKISRTPDIYPRNKGRMIKKPL